MNNYNEHQNKTIEKLTIKKGELMWAMRDQQEKLCENMNGKQEKGKIKTRMGNQTKLACNCLIT
jgi:hypothetical protein